MGTFLGFVLGVVCGVVASVLVYYNNTRKVTLELEALRGERDALKGRLEALIDYLRGKVK